MDATMTEAVVATAQSTDVAAQPTGAAAAAAPAAAVAAQAAPIVAQLAQPRAATLAELKAACPGATADFLIQQQEANATVGQATTAWMAKLAADNQTLSRENATLRTAKPNPTAAAATASAVDLVPAGVGGNASAATGGDAIAQWEQKLEELQEGGKRTKAQAARQLAISEPELQAAYCAAWTKLHGDKVNPRGRAA